VLPLPQEQGEAAKRQDTEQSRQQRQQEKGTGNHRGRERIKAGETQRRQGHRGAAQEAETEVASTDRGGIAQLQSSRRHSKVTGIILRAKFCRNLAFREESLNSFHAELTDDYSALTVRVR